MNRGVLYGLAAYGLWGLLPLFWKAIEAAPSHEILVHRTFWSFVFLSILLAARRDGAWLRAALGRRTLLPFLGSALLLSANWLTYIWAVNHEHIVESSLGYFINPLLNVVLGMIFLGERLRPGQAVAVGLAAVAVALLTIAQGSPPWIALVLAFTFGFYGLLRKTAPLGALHGLAFETGILFLPALGALVAFQVAGTSHFGPATPGLSVGLALTGVATSVPLLLFAAAARRVTLTTVGLMQYLAPTLQLGIGVAVYGEAMRTVDWVAFPLIWLALGIYSMEGVRHARRSPTAPPRDA